MEFQDKILRIVNQGHCQHVLEKVYGAGVVVGVSTLMLSSQFEPPYGLVEKSCGTRIPYNQPRAIQKVAATAKAMVVQAQ